MFINLRTLFDVSSVIIGSCLSLNKYVPNVSNIHRINAVSLRAFRISELYLRIYLRRGYSKITSFSLYAFPT